MSVKAPAWIVRGLYHIQPFTPCITGRLSVNGVPEIVSLFGGLIMFVSR